MTINTGSSTNGQSTIPFSQSDTFALNQVLMFDTTLNAFVNTALPVGATTGEINTGSNLGAGQGVFKDKLGADMRFKSVVAGTGISVTSDADEIFIAATNTGTGDITGGTSTGSGNAVFRDKTGANLRFRSLTAGTNVTLTQNADDIVINASTNALTLNGIADTGYAKVANNLSDVTAATARTNLSISSTAEADAKYLHLDTSKAPTADATTSLGTGVKRFNEIYAVSFKGNADTATTATSLVGFTPADYVAVAGGDTMTGTLTLSGAPTNALHAATKDYVDTSIASLVDSSPGALDTLNELAAAIGDDANFSTTVTNSIATKLPLAGGTLTGALILSGAPTIALHAATKAYVDAGDVLKLTAANNLSDVANAATARTNLGLGTAATTASTAYLAAGTLTTGIAEGTNLYYTDARADARIAAATLTALSDVDAVVAGDDGKVLYYDHSTTSFKWKADTITDTDALAEGSTNLYYTDARADARITAAVGSSVQAYDADLTAIGALAKTDGNFIVANGTTWVAEDAATARASLGLGTIYYTKVETDNRFANVVGVDANLADIADAAAARTNLGLGSAAVANTSAFADTVLSNLSNATTARANLGTIGFAEGDARYVRLDVNYLPTTDNAVVLGDTTKRFNTIYARQFKGSFDGSFSGSLDTDALAEGSTNLYYTDARADARITNAGSANWNTAYGWGDHASGGYLTSTGVLSSHTDVHTAAPTDGQVLTWVNANNRWEPAATSGTGTVTSITAGTGLTGGTITTTGTIAVDVGTTASKIVQLDGSAKLPAVDGSQLTNLPSGSSTLTGLTDVDAVVAGDDGKVLYYNHATTSFKWKVDDDTPAGYNNTNWDTAYGWGDHGSAGYLTSIAANSINDTHIDWGTGANQVSTADIPENTNLYYTDARADARAQLKIDALIDSAPGTLDTLNELAASIGDDANFAGTMTTALAGKEPTITAGTAAQYYKGNKTWATLDTAAVAENTNLYYTDARADARITAANVLQDSDFTSQGIMVRNASAGSYQILTNNSANWNTAFGWGDHGAAGYLTSIAADSINDTHIDWGTGSNQVSTADVPESSNLYYTDARVDARVSTRSVDILFDVDTTTTAPTNSQVLTWNASSSKWVPATPPGSSGGEANTGANVGSAGVGIFDAKVGTALNFKKLNSLNANLTIVDDAANDKIDFDLAGYNNTNWDTAHGWGDHGAAGYLTSTGVLSSHTDVHNAAPTDGQVLKWVNANSRWEPATDAGGMANIVEDTTPQLGGDLDGNSNAITNVKRLEIADSAHNQSSLVIANPAHTATGGTSQQETWALGGQTTNNTQTEIFVGATASNRVGIGYNDVAMFEIDVIAVNSSTPAENASWKFKAFGYNNGGTLSIIGNITEDEINPQANWSVDFGTSTYNLTVLVTGENSKTISWGAFVKVTEISSG